MTKRIFSITLALLLLFSSSLTAIAASKIAPDSSWWGMSRTNYKKEYPNIKFEEIDVGQRKALVIRDVSVGSYRLDCYYYFGIKGQGKSYYGMSNVLYIMPLSYYGYSSSELKVIYDNLVEIVTKESGKPKKSSSKTTTWESLKYNISVEIGSFTDYNGSTSDTVAIIYSDPSAGAISNSPTTKTANVGTPTTKSGTLKITAKATCSNYNHVGNEWYNSFYVNGSYFSGTKSMTFTVGDVVEVSATITEDDKKPDVGSEYETHTITASDLEKGFTISFSVRVRENGGRYSGNVATWQVTFTFSK